MSAGLIVPENIPGIDVDPSLISSSAAGYRASSASIGTGADAVLASWSGLSAVYAAPEGPQLLAAAMNPVGVDAHAIQSKLTTMSNLLVTLAEDVAEPVKRLKLLKIEAEEFVASFRGGVEVEYFDPDNELMQANSMSGSPGYMPEWQGTQVLNWDQHTPSVDITASLQPAEGWVVEDVVKSAETASALPIWKHPIRRRIRKRATNRVVFRQAGGRKSQPHRRLVARANSVSVCGTTPTTGSVVL